MTHCFPWTQQEGKASLAPLWPWFTSANGLMNQLNSPKVGGVSCWTLCMLQVDEFFTFSGWWKLPNKSLVPSYPPLIAFTGNAVCRGQNYQIIKYTTQPNHGLFTLLPTGRCYRCLSACTNTLRNSFFPISAPTLNNWSHWTVYLLTF